MLRHWVWTQRLTSLIGTHRSLVVILEGKPFTPAAALANVAVDELVPQDRVVSRAAERAKYFGSRPKGAIAAIKSSVAILLDTVTGDHYNADELSPSSVAAVAGYPHITVPMGSYRGLPIGVSFFGRAWSEATLIKIAYAYEQATKHRRPPGFPLSINPNP